MVPVDRTSVLAASGDLLAVAIGGMVGTLLRALLFLAAGSNPDRIPWVTLGENLAGAFLLGLFLSLLPRWAPTAARLHPLFATGLLGAFTTFSALTVDFLALGPGWPGLLYLFLSITGGVTAAGIGLALGRVSGDRGWAR